MFIINQQNRSILAQQGKKYTVFLLGVSFLLALVAHFPGWLLLFFNDTPTELKFRLAGILTGATLFYYILILAIAYIPKFSYFILRSPKKNNTPKRRTYVIACIIILLLIISNHSTKFLHSTTERQILTLFENPPVGLDTIITFEEFELPDDLTSYGVLTPLLVETQAAVRSFNIANNEYVEATENLAQKLNSLQKVILEAATNKQPLAEFLDAQAKLGNLITSTEVLISIFPKEIRKLQISRAAQAELLELYESSTKLNIEYTFSTFENHSQQLQIVEKIIEFVVANHENIILYDDDFEFLDDKSEHIFETLVAQLKALDEEALLNKTRILGSSMNTNKASI